MTRMFGRTAIAALAICSLAACSKDKDDASTTTTDSTTVASTPTPPPAPQMTDANMLASLAAGDSTDMALGNAMKTTATFPALKSLGSMLIADHTAHLKD